MDEATFRQSMPQALQTLVQTAAAIEAVSPDTARRALSLIDHTSLKTGVSMTGSESDDEIRALCVAAMAYGVAAVCVYPNHIGVASAVLADSGVALAVVNNFPLGSQDAVTASRAAKDAVGAGAIEIDTVIDRAALEAGEHNITADKLRAVYAATRDAGGRLKTILQASTYPAYGQLYDAAMLAIEAGCDFVKTCTGKPPAPQFGIAPDVSNLPVAVTVMQAVADSGRSGLGVKISGGVSTVLDCERMRFLHAQIIGGDKFTPAFFRFGASSLAGNLRESKTDGGY